MHVCEKWYFHKTAKKEIIRSVTWCTFKNILVKLHKSFRLGKQTRTDPVLV